MEKPDWWPINPYPESVWPMQLGDISEIVRDPDELTAISGCMGRHFWEVASDDVCRAVQEELDFLGLDGNLDELLQELVRLRAERGAAKGVTV